MKKLLCISSLLIILIIACFLSCDDEANDDSALVFGSVSDVEGNSYKTIEIGTQTWMAENLKVAKFNNSDPIPIVLEYDDWKILETPACCKYENSNSYNLVYGKLYNFYTASDSRNVCPDGWHVPSNAEWNMLIDFLGGELQAANKLKETGTEHWQTTSSIFTNESGFTALPGGYRFVLSNNGYEGIRNYGCWWTSTVSPYDNNNAIYRVMGSATSEVDWGSSYKTAGYSVRCIKD